MIEVFGPPARGLHFVLANGFHFHHLSIVSIKTSMGELRPGDRAVITEVRGDRGLACRLMEMGLLPGTTVEAVRIAPFGDPVEYRLRGYMLSLRRAEASAVSVDRVLPREEGERARANAPARGKESR